MKKLLSNASTNPKTAKQLKHFAFEGVIQHLTPDKLADKKHTVCPWSTPGCRAACLNTSGRSQIKGGLNTKNLRMYQIHRARIGKTLEFINNTTAYMNQLEKELLNLERRAGKKGYTAVARLNGTSDVPWESYLILEKYNIQFYDYTKSIARMRKFLKKKWPARWPANYHLTFSYSEHTKPEEVKEIVEAGGNVAVVFRKEIPAEFMGHKVIDGTTHDFRFLDPMGCIVGLVAKGRAKYDTTGFVV